MSPDGRYAYYDLAFSNNNNQLYYFDLVNASVVSSVPLNGVIWAATDEGATATDSSTGKRVAYYPVLVTTEAGVTGADVQLSIVDIDSTSDTRNSVLRTIVPNLSDSLNTQSVAVTPDGRYVYTSVAACSDSLCTTSPTHLIIFDTLAGNDSVIADITTIGAAATQYWMHISPDANSLLMSDSNGNILVYDISAGPLTTASSPIATITGVGTNPIGFAEFRVVGTRLFATGCDQGQCYVQVFNFIRGTPNNFTFLGSYAYPLSWGGFTITPDGKSLYVALNEESAVAVLDANAVAASSPTALITKIATGVSPHSFEVSSQTTASADISVCAVSSLLTDSGPYCGTTATVAVLPNQESYLYFTVTNLGPATNTGVSFAATVPAGVSLVSATAYPNHVTEMDMPISCAISTNTVACILPDLGVYNPNDSKPASIDVVLGITPTVSTPLTVSASVAANELDRDTTNDATSVTLTGGADLQVSATANTSFVTVGSQVTYTIFVTNNGPLDASSMIADFYSTALGSESVNVTTTQGYCSGGYCTLGAMPAGTTATITAVASITDSVASSSVNGAFTSSVSVQDLYTPDPNTSNNTANIVTNFTAGTMPSEYLFTGNSIAGELHVTDLTTDSPAIFPNTVLGGVPVGLLPDDIILSPNRHLAFVATQGNYISVLDTTIQRVIQRIHLGGPAHRLAMTSDGKLLLVAPIGNDSLELIDLTKFPFRVTQSINLNGIGGNPTLPVGATPPLPTWSCPETLATP